MASQNVSELIAKIKTFSVDGENSDVITTRLLLEILNELRISNGKAPL